jgi:hypothetical protein
LAPPELRLRNIIIITTTFIPTRPTRIITHTVMATIIIPTAGDFSVVLGVDIIVMDVAESVTASAVDSTAVAVDFTAVAVDFTAVAVDSTAVAADSTAVAADSTAVAAVTVADTDNSAALRGLHPTRDR